MTSEPRHLRRPEPRPDGRSLVTKGVPVRRVPVRRVVDPPTVQIAPVMPGWKISRTHAVVLGLIMLTLVILVVEPVRNGFLLGLVVGGAVLAEVLSRIGDAFVWIGESVIVPVLDEIISWF